jgi:thioredoxin reductase (NADPH)
MNFDVIIIGGGAAGLSAALWCDELGLSALLLDKEEEPGGQLLWTYNPVKNHLGAEAENGRKLRDIFLNQTEHRDFILKLQAEAAEIDLENKTVLLKNGEHFSAKALIIATGVRRRKLNVEGEEYFRNKGILESGKRDKALVKGKRAAIIGGGDAALENALILAETASSVFVIHRRSDFRARAEFVEQAKNNSKITFLVETRLRKIIGNERVEAVELENPANGETYLLTVEAILIRIGVEPNTEFLLRQLGLDEGGYIKINNLCQTSVKGVWAIGDVSNPIAPTISSAVGMGATAVKSISAWLK